MFNRNEFIEDQIQLDDKAVNLMTKLYDSMIEEYNVSQFSAGSRKLLIECAEKLDWSTIDPDVFGSMIQAAVHPKQRASMGMHYTSVSNIMKVIEPLFLNELLEEFRLNKDNIKKLNVLLNKLYNLKIFDPACGSGNFLITTYKELCKLEMQIFQQLNILNGEKCSYSLGINLSQFYGIEIDSFACEVAALSLWIAKHQMNMEFKKIFNKVNPSLPLKEASNIVCGNAARLAWEEVCPKNDGDEIYIIGNPPYLGFCWQNNEQKKDLALAMENRKGAKSLDYISCWFAKGASYIQDDNAKLAFVSTNSICQGEQVGFLWPHIFVKGLEIGFAHRSFKWTNNAKKNAGVTCIIVCLRNKSNEAKYVMDNGIQYQVNNINAYLQDGSDLIISGKATPISKLSKMYIGNAPYDGGHLIMPEIEKDNILIAHPEANKFIKKFIGSQELIQGKQRYCLWIKENDVKEACQFEAIKSRIDAVRLFRLKSSAVSTRNFAEKPYRFVGITYKESNSIIVPRVFSESREYITAAFLDKDYVISDSAHAIYDAEPYVFGIISSKIHMAWVKAVAGRLKSDLRYSSSLCYNNFPVPDLTDKQKEIITHNALNVISEREKHSEKTIAQLYDPKNMPEGLRDAHRNLDIAVESCYRAKPFASDEERLSHLFKLYEQMTEVKKDV